GTGACQEVKPAHPGSHRARRRARARLLGSEGLSIMTVKRELEAITSRIRERSRATREAYLQRLDEAASSGPHRSALACGNLAHGFAACAPGDKAALSGNAVPNLGIVTAYNDMLSAHQPYETFPELI